MSRYSRQELFAGIGVDGQERLGGARALVVGCGALGSSLSETLVRAGVGSVTVVDRDFVEESNLQRQALFDEQDAAERLPKTVAAERRLRRINGSVSVLGIVADVASDNARSLVEGQDLVLDGTDNFETRFLVNDVCVQAGIPWVYGACVGSHGLALLVRPGTTPCLRCLLRELPAAGSQPTCDTVGIVSPIVQVVAAVQAAEALKLLAGRAEALLPGLVSVDVWTGAFDVLDLRGRAPSCPGCTQGRFAPVEAGAAVLCGRGAVQIRASRGGPIDLPALAARLRAAGEVTANDYLVRFAQDGAELVVFQDGRALVRGVADVAQARSLYARYVGN
jgi:adenylyltransferase/sulfurtransferase